MQQLKDRLIAKITASVVIFAIVGAFIHMSIEGIPLECGLGAILAGAIGAATAFIFADIAQKPDKKDDN